MILKDELLRTCPKKDLFKFSAIVQGFFFFLLSAQKKKKQKEKAPATLRS